MMFSSTRCSSQTATISKAIERGIAPDGGLYVPCRMPLLQGTPQSDSLVDIAEWVLRPFFDDDPLGRELGEIIQNALNFPLVLSELCAHRELPHVLELFHGPTLAFKDFGARFYAECLERIHSKRATEMSILVATSGDTGGAVAAAFQGRPWARVFILFPAGKVSRRQQHQLTCWSGNIHSLAVEGDFDDCQRLVKLALCDQEILEGGSTSSANSINLGRLLPQLTYYAVASLRIKAATGQAPSYVIPSGNIGNAVACVWARQIGIPINQIVLAHNANSTVPDYLNFGQWAPRSGIRTLATAMDVGNPSNFERLKFLYPTVRDMRNAISAASVDDSSIRRRIMDDFDAWGRIWCPHSAVAAEAYARLDEESRERERWVLVATAHPAKFDEVVTPIIGEPVELPATLAALLGRATRHRSMQPNIEALRGEVLSSNDRNRYSHSSSSAS